MILSLITVLACAGTTVRSTSAGSTTFTTSSTASNLALQPPYNTVQLRAISRTNTGVVIRDLSMREPPGAMQVVTAARSVASDSLCTTTTVSGVVQDSTGTPLAGVWIQELGVQRFGQSVQADSHGAFTLSADRKYRLLGVSGDTSVPKQWLGIFRKETTLQVKQCVAAPITLVVRNPIVPPGGPTLTFEWKAANLALQPPYDTVQLRAIARTATGEVIRDAAVQYSTPDTDITVSTTGLVTARRPTVTWHVSHIIARVVRNGHVMGDTAVIRVTPTPPPTPLTALSIQPHAGGLTNAQINLKEESFIPVIMAFGKNQPRETICTESTWDSCPLVVGFASSDRSIAYPASYNGGATDSRVLRSVQTGQVTVTVSTIAYGLRKRDSLRVSVGYAKTTNINVKMIDASRHPPLLGLHRDENFPPPYSVGTRIWISNSTGDPVEVSLPATPRGAHFISINDLKQEFPNTTDTLAKDAESGSNKMLVVKLDSAGTYVLRYRHLNTGAVVEDTFPVLPYP